MKFTLGDFEAALRQKRQAVEEAPRPAKKARKSGPTAPVEAPVVPAVAGEVAEERPISKGVSDQVPGPSGTAAEEGEIQATAASVMVVLDEEEDPAPVEVPRAGESPAAAGLPTPAEPGMERTPPPDRRKGGPAAETPGRVGEAAGKKGGESGSSSGRPPRALICSRGERVPGRSPRPAPIFRTMTDAGEAACLLQGLRTAASKEETRAMDHAALLDSVMVTVVQMGNGIMSLREVIAHSSDALSKAIKRADKYKKESLTHAQSLARLHQEAKGREEDLGSKVREAENRASAAEAELRRVSSQLEELQLQKEELANRLQSAVEEVKTAREEAGAATERAVAADKAAVEANHERAGAMAHADDARARAEEAENRAWEADQRAAEAERKAQQAEAEARRAVADFKASPDFSKEVLEASLDAFVQGFESCKAKAAAVLKIDASQLEGIRPGEPAEEPPAP